MKKQNWRKYTIEFLSIFIAVISAFALDNWNDNSRDRNIEEKILKEISNGLEKDIDDITINKNGHLDGIRACDYWRRVITNEQFDQDSLGQQYLNLTRDFISIQNVSGYESLKSKGLETIKDDSLRLAIISLYEYDFNILRKFEEEYNEMQFQESYFKGINEVIAPNFVFDSLGQIVQIELPLKLSNPDKKILLSYLWKIQQNRGFILRFYNRVEEKTKQLNDQIRKRIKR